MIKREHKEERILKRIQKRTEKYKLYFLKQREETRAKKPAGRAETGATSIPMKY